jgi:hypothetical protein
VAHPENSMVFPGAYTCLTSPGVRTRTTDTRTDTVERQATRMHPANPHRIFGMDH